MHSYIFQKKSQVEYEDSIIWYSKRSIVSAENFVQEIDIALLKICQSPKIWKNEYAHFYEFYLRKFLFTIVYSIDELKKLIIIHSVFHQKRNPKKKIK